MSVYMVAANTIHHGSCGLVASVIITQIGCFFLARTVPEETAQHVLSDDEEAGDSRTKGERDQLRVSENQGPLYRPQIVGFLLEGHPQKGALVYCNSHL